MQTDPLPERVDFRRLAAKQVRLSGDLPLARLSRLAERLLDSNGLVHIDAEFDRDGSGRYCLKGQLQVRLAVRCERCLEPMVRQMEHSFCLAAVWSEDDASQLPDEYDPWVTGEDRVSLVDIVEEELLLSLPLVNYHETPCMPGLVKTEEECVPVATRQNPFQALDALRKKT